MRIVARTVRSMAVRFVAHLFHPARGRLPPMKTKWIGIALFSILISLAFVPAPRAHDPLRIVYNVGVAPLKFEDEARRLLGFLPDLWEAWSRKTGMEIEFVRAETFEESLDLLRQGKVDLHAGLFKTPEREEFLDYSDRILTLDYHIFTHPSVMPVKSLESTGGLLIGVQRGGFTERFVRSKIPSSSRIVVYERFQDLFRAALNGEIKVFISTELSLLYYLKENWHTNLFEFNKDHPLYTQTYHTATRRGNRDLIELVNEGFKALGADTRKKIRDKWIVPGFDRIPLEMEPLLSNDERRFLARTKSISVHNETAGAPINFNEKGIPRGFSIDYMKLLGEKIGLRIDFVNGPSWDEFLSMMKDGTLDVMLNICETHDREKYLTFTPPYVTMAQALYTRKDYPMVHSIEDLYLKRVAAPKGSYIAEMMMPYPQIEIVEVDDGIDAVLAVSVGRADALYDVMPVVNHIMGNFQVTNLKVGGDIGLHEGRPMPLHLAVRKDMGTLSSILEKGMSLISEEEYRTIHAGWLGIPEEHARTLSLNAKEREWLHAHPVIRVHNEMDWPPYNYFEYGRPKGLSIDFMNILAERLGVTVEYVSGPSWDELEEMARRRELDVMLNIVKTEDRLAYLLFTDPFAQNPNVIVGTNETRYESIEELYGKTVAFPKGFYYEEVLSKSFPRIKPLPVEDTLASLKAVTFGEADAALGKEAAVRGLIVKNLLSDLRISGEVDLGNPDLANLRIGVRSDWPLLHSALMKAMSQVTPLQMSKLRESWLIKSRDRAVEAHARGETHTVGRLIAYGMGMFLILCLVVWISIRTIKKENIAVSFGSVWFRMFILAGLSFFVIIVCFLAWLTLEKNKEKVLSGVRENLKTIVTTACDKLDLWVEQRKSSLKTLGLDPELVSIVKRLSAVTHTREDLLASSSLGEIRAFFKGNRDMFSPMEFGIIDPDYITIASMHDSDLGTRNPISLKSPDLLARAFRGESIFVPPLHRDSEPETPSRAHEASSPHHMFFVVPVRDTHGQVIAVLSVQVDPSGDFSRSLHLYWTGESGETYAFDKHGTLVSNSRYREHFLRSASDDDGRRVVTGIEVRDPGVDTTEGRLPKLPLSDRHPTRMASGALGLKRDMETAGRITGHSDVKTDVKGYRDYRGVPVFGAWLWNAGLGLGLAAEVDSDEALSTYHMTRWTVSGVLGITLLLSVSATLLVLVLGERTSKALAAARDDLEIRVTERTAELRENQKRVEAAEERTRLLLYSAGEGIFGVDEEGICTFANPAALHMLGFGPEHLQGGDIHALIHHSLKDGSPYPVETCPMFRAYTHGETVTVSDEVLWNRDGASFPVEYTATPVLRGEIVTGAVITFRDITERKRIEEVLATERERLQGMLDTSPIGMSIATEGVMRFVNPRLTELLGLRKGDPSSGFYVNVRDRDRIMEELEHHSVVADYELQAYGPDREIRDILATFSRTEYGGKPGIIAWLVDITVLKKAEKELRNRYDDLARFRRLAVGRENRMIDLKKEINELRAETGKASRYKIVTEAQGDVPGGGHAGTS